MRGFRHQAGREPVPNVDCGVLDFDKTECCLSDSQHSALYVRPDHIQTTSAPPPPHPLTIFSRVVRVFVFFSQTRQLLYRHQRSLLFFPLLLITNLYPLDVLSSHDRATGNTSFSHHWSNHSICVRMYIHMGVYIF